MLFMQMPQWIVDLWAGYSDIIMPVIAGVIPVILSWLVVKLKSYVKLSNDKEEKLLEILALISNKESSAEILQTQVSEIKTIKEAVTYLGAMVNIAYQNSNLDPEVKANIESLVNKLKNGTEEDLVAELEQANAILKEQLEEAKNKLIEKVVVTAAEEVRTRVRK